MKSYFRRSVDVGDNTRYIIRYTPSDYLFISIIKFIFFLGVVWPGQIVWLIIKFAFSIIFFPFRLMGRLYKSSAPISVKIGVTVLVVIVVLTLMAVGAGRS